MYCVDRKALYLYGVGKCMIIYKNYAATRDFYD
jgi:hypothetical protein